MVKPIAGPPVAPELLRAVPKPKMCELTPGSPTYTGAELSASIDCWRSAWAVAAGKHEALSKAVRQREQKVAEAVKAAVQ